MRMILLAAVSCMLVGSVNGMEEMDRSIISPRVKTAIKTTGKHVGDFAQGYALGSAAVLSLCTATIFGADDNSARKNIGTAILFGASATTGVKSLMNVPGGNLGGDDKYTWRQVLYIMGGVSGVFSTGLLYGYSFTSYQEQCESSEAN